jgi:TonB family protein
MRKTITSRSLNRSILPLCLTALASVSLAVLAQEPASAQDTASADHGAPNELMLAAAKINGLRSPDLQPWHLKATYKLMDEDGNSKSQGTIEEFWVSPTKYKVTYTSGSLSHTEYGTDKGTYTMGDAGVDPYAVFRLQREWLEPLPPPEAVMRSKYAFQIRETGEISATCLQQQDGFGSTVGPIWCLDRDTHELRITVNGNSEDVLHSNLASFEGQTIAQDLKFSAGELKSIASDKAAFSAHLETIEPLTTIDDTAFVPPPNAHAEMRMVIAGISGSGLQDPAILAVRPKKISISGGVAQGNLMQRVAPAYPADAKAAGISGTVVLQALIGTDGRISECRVISGPPALEEASVDAVRQWVYRPYLLNGEPVAVQTTINVVFNLGSGPRF